MRLWVFAALGAAAIYCDPFDARVVLRESRGEVVIEDIAYRNSQNTFTAVCRICPAKPPASIAANHSQFVEASTLARQGPTWPEIDKQRIADVGHVFGAMLGTRQRSDEPRVEPRAFQVAAPRWHERYLPGIPASALARDQMGAETGPLDPIAHISRLKGGVSFQLGDNDRHVPKKMEEESYAAAPELKKALWYEAGYDSNAQAGTDRIVLLTERLKLNR